MAGRCGSCNKAAGKTFIVKRPGEADRTVSNESAAQALVKGVAGATYTVKITP